MDNDDQKFDERADGVSITRPPAAGWERHVDSSSGIPYYTNPSNGDVSWEKPVGPVVKLEPSDKPKKKRIEWDFSVSADRPTPGQLPPTSWNDGVGQFTGWQCPVCDEYNPEEYARCYECEQMRPLASDCWRCDVCSAENPVKQDSCHLCMTPRESSDQPGNVELKEVRNDDLDHGGMEAQAIEMSRLAAPSKSGMHRRKPMRLQTMSKSPYSAMAEERIKKEKKQDNSSKINIFWADKPWIHLLIAVSISAVAITLIALSVSGRIEVVEEVNEHGAEAGEASEGHFEYPPYDGFYNNPAHPDWGAAETQLQRITPAAYSDGVFEPAGLDRPGPRELSQAGMDGPDGSGSYNNLTAMCTFYGQQVVEEIMDSQRRGCPIEYFSIKIPKGDPVYDATGTGTFIMPFQRTRYDQRTGLSTSVPRQQLNEISSFIDGSLMYGPFKAWTDAIRSYSQGQLASIQEGGGEFPTLNTNGLPFANAPPPVQHFLKKSNRFWTIGNPRGNENPMLLSFGILWFREHNRLARQFAAAHPDWDDELLFNEARKWTIALHQHITVNEWFPVFANTALDPYDHYNAELHPGISQVFQSAAMRFGHTLVPPGVYRRNGTCAFNATTMRVCNTYLNPQDFIRDSGGIDPIMMGMASQITEREDNIVVEDLRGFVFGSLQNSRRDLMALNIQRGRDHGLPDYNTARRTFRLPPITRFEQLSSNATVVAHLKQLYNNDTENIDIWVGGILDSGPDGPGALFKAVLKDQFTRIRDGDRFWYANKLNGLFNDTEIAQIEATKLSDIIIRNTQIRPGEIQANVFRFLPGDPCPQPAQLSSSTLEPCTPNEGFDYWRGSEYIPFLVIAGCLFFIALLLVWKRGIIVQQTSSRRRAALTVEYPPVHGNLIGQDAKDADNVLVRVRAALRVYTANRHGEGQMEALPVYVSVTSDLHMLVHRWEYPSRLHLVAEYHVPSLRGVHYSKTLPLYVLLQFRPEVSANALLAFATPEEFAAFKDTVSPLFEEVPWVEYESGAAIMDDPKLRSNLPKYRGKLVTSLGQYMANTVQQYNRDHAARDFAQQEDVVLASLESLVAHAKQGALAQHHDGSSMADLHFTERELASLLSIKSAFLASNVFREARFLSSGAADDVRAKSYVNFEGLLRLCLRFTSSNETIRGKAILNILLGRNSEHRSVEELLHVVAACVDPLADAAGMKSSQDEKESSESKPHARSASEVEAINTGQLLHSRVSMENLKDAFNKSSLADAIRAVVLNESKDAPDATTPHGAVARLWPVAQEPKIAGNRRVAGDTYSSFFTSVKRTIQNNRGGTFIMLVFLLTQVFIGWSRWVDYSMFREHRGMRRMLGLGVSVTRAAASEMMFCLALLLLSMAKNVLTALRDSWVGRYIPFDQFFVFHKWVAYFLLLWTLTHCVGHMFNFYNITNQPATDLTCTFRQVWHYSDELPHFNWWMFQTATGLSGVLLIIVMCIMYAFAEDRIRAVSHSLFMKTHQLFYVVYFLSWLHGSYALIQIPDFKYFIAIPTVVFLIDRLILLSRHGWTLPTTGQTLPADVTFVSITRPPGFEYVAGQYVNIMLPDINDSFHPFTICSAPHMQDLHLYVRALGPWTRELRSLYAKAALTRRFPKCVVDGPYGEGHQDWHRYSEVVLIGAGIGVTPFASILADVAHRLLSGGARLGRAANTATERLHFIWTCKDQAQWRWLDRDVRRLDRRLRRAGLSDFFHPHFYVTGVGSTTGQIREFSQFQVELTSRVVERQVRTEERKRIKEMPQKQKDFVAESMIKSSEEEDSSGGSRRVLFRRPDYLQLLRQIRENALAVEVGVFTCAPDAVVNAAAEASEALNDEVPSMDESDRVYFRHYHQTFGN